MKSSTRAIYISDASGKTAPEAWQPGFKQATFRPRTDQRASKTLAECTAQRSRQCKTGENDLRHSPARHLRHERPEPIFLRGHIAFGCAGSSGLCMHPCGSESGRVDVIVRLIQVKAGTARLSASERETISSLAVPCGLVPGSCDLDASGRRRRTTSSSRRSTQGVRSPLPTGLSSCTRTNRYRAMLSSNFERSDGPSVTVLGRRAVPYALHGPRV